MEDPAIRLMRLATLRRDAIASIESRGSGDYAARGPVTKSGDRAYGRYQMMGNNIPEWSRRALGRPVGIDEFMASSEIQDKVFDTVFGDYAQKYGERGAAQAWFGGPGSVGKEGRKDMLGTSVGGYGERYLKAMRQPAGPDERGEGSGYQTAPEMAGTINPAEQLLQKITGGQGGQPGAFEYQPSWIENQDFGAKALLNDVFSGQNPMKRLAYQGLSRLFGVI